jgi:hypothetical protein
METVMFTRFFKKRKRRRKRKFNWQLIGLSGELKAIRNSFSSFPKTEPLRMKHEKRKADRTIHY